MVEMYGLWPVLMLRAGRDECVRHLLHAALERRHPALHRLLELARRHDRPATTATACTVWVRVGSRVY